MFIGAEVRPAVSFNAAQARRANLARGGLLYRDSDKAYRDLDSGLARVGPLGAAPGKRTLLDSEPSYGADGSSRDPAYNLAGLGRDVRPEIDEC